MSRSRILIDQPFTDNSTKSSRSRSTNQEPMIVTVSTDANPAKNSPLINYALKGLDRCWLPECGRWSHAYHLDGRDPPNQSIPHSDVFYTLNVLLGMSRVADTPKQIDIEEIFVQNARQLQLLPVRKYALGMALWTAAELGLRMPKEVSDHIWSVVSERRNWKYLRAQDLGMLLTGAVAQARAGSDIWVQTADELFAHLLSAYCWPSGLFADAASGLRRRFASFASQVYLTLACYFYGELKDDERAVELANRCCRKLISLQGMNGEWPWFFDAANGIVVDFYEVYSVHQIGMAPAFLQIAERHGIVDARAALIKGFKWTLGHNALALPMLCRPEHLTIRSQARRGELHSDKWRAVRAICNSVLKRSSHVTALNGLELRRECRSYELGWVLWSFGGRSDYPDLTNHALFQEKELELVDQQSSLSRIN